MKILYLAGPISANPAAKDGFAAATAVLENAGYVVKNPFDIDPADYLCIRKNMSQEEIDLAQLKADLIEMLCCDGIATVSIDHRSVGTIRELALAFSLQMQVLPVGDWIKIAMLEGGQNGQG